MSARFTIDLLRPGRVAMTWQEFFVGPHGRQHFLIASGVGAVILVAGLAFILAAYWRVSADRDTIPRLQRDLAATEQDLGTLRTNLRALTNEARRQVRWAELLGTFSQQIPATLRLQVVEASRVQPPPPAPGQPPGPTESLLRVEALTPLRPGHPPLLEIAQFMAGIMRDPAVNKRFQLKSWEIRPPTTGSQDGTQYLNILITFAERPA
jgi:hypothetical protein